MMFLSEAGPPVKSPQRVYDVFILTDAAASHTGALHRACARITPRS